MLHLKTKEEVMILMIEKDGGNQILREKMVVDPPVQLGKVEDREALRKNVITIEINLVIQVMMIETQKVDVEDQVIPEEMKEMSGREVQEIEVFIVRIYRIIQLTMRDIEKEEKINVDDRKARGEMKRVTDQELPEEDVMIIVINQIIRLTKKEEGLMINVDDRKVPGRVIKILNHEVLEGDVMITVIGRIIQVMVKDLENRRIVNVTRDPSLPKNKIEGPELLIEDL